MRDNTGARSEFAQQHLFQHAKSGRRGSAGTVFIEWNVFPIGVFLVEDAFEPTRHRGHSHLNKKTWIVNDLCKWSREDELVAFRLHDHSKVKLWIVAQQSDFAACV